MSDVITRFKLETTQYDSKLRDAAKGLKEISHMAELGGKGFKEFTQNQVEAARAFGQTASGANNLKDKVKDLVGSFNDAAKAYNALTKEQQQTDFGKALAESLTTLKGRISEAKQELYGLADAAEKVKSSSGGGGLFGEGGLTGMLQVAGGNLLAQGITKLGSEITDTIQQSIELARQGEGVRIAFERLNRPGLLDNLKESTHGTVSELELMKAAVKFDDFKLPVEQLGTMLEFAQKKAKDTGQSVDYMVDSIVTGLGRKSLMILDNLGLSAAQVKDKMKETGDMTKAVAEIIKEQMSEAGEYVETAADRAARAAADAQNQMYDLGKSAMPIAEEFAQMWNTIKIGAMDLLNTAIGPLARSLASIQRILNGGGFGFKSGIPNLGNGPAASQRRQPGRDHVVQAPGGYVEVTDSNTGAVIGGRHFDNLEDTNSINGWKKGLFKTTHAKGGKTTADKIAFDANRAAMAGVMAVDTMPSVWAMMNDEQKRQLLGVGPKQSDLGRVLKQYVDDPYKDKRQKGVKEKSDFSEFSNQFNQITGAVSGIFNGIEQLGIELPEGIKNILGGIQTIAGILTAISSLITIITTIQGAKAVPVFGFLLANGGVAHAANGYTVPGNNFSGDMVPAMLNSGELVLNRAQQGNLASQLRGGGMQNIQLSAVVAGEQLLLVQNNTLKRRNRGELATWR